MYLTCRFYKNRLPKIDDLVMVNVVQIEELGVYVNLLEYNNREGMILLTEMSRRRIRSINKLIRIGQNEVVLVIRVDRDKGYIDLSKRRASPEDATKCKEKFHRGKLVHSILRLTADALGLQTNDEFEELYDKTAWFFDERDKKQGAAYDVFLRAVDNESELNECPIDEKTKQILINNIRRFLSPQSVKCRADIEVACFGYEGIDAVKAALREGLNASTDEMPLKINLIAPPLYVVTTMCLDSKKGINTLQKAIDKIKESIEKYRGIFKIKLQPQIVTDDHEKALQKQREEEDPNNAPKLGDDDNDSDQDDSTEDDLSDEDDNKLFETTKKSEATAQKLIVDNDDAEEKEE